MPLFTRRKALALGLLGGTSILNACGGAKSDPAAADASIPTTIAAAPVSPAAPASATPAPILPAAWNVPPIYVPAGSNATVDLSATLPNGIAKGGAFGVSATGAALPAGITLSPAGILSLGSVTTGPVVGVIFTYTEPGT